jgi:hypothetical protein
MGVVADVSGKGISAALLGSLMQGALSMEFRSTARPDLVLGRRQRVPLPEDSFEPVRHCFRFSPESWRRGPVPERGA